MPLTIVRDDITELNTDAIVLPANENLRMGRGTSSDIFRAAGADQLEAACREIGYCAAGNAVLTAGFNLPAKHIIHAVCPRYIDGCHMETEILYDAYFNALKLARTIDINSIAFPLLSSGTYGYPKGAALSTANSAINDFLIGDENEMDVRLVIYDQESAYWAGEIFGDLIDDLDYFLRSKMGHSYYSSPKSYTIENEFEALPQMECSFSCDNSLKSVSLEELLEEKQETFNDKLTKYIIRSEMTNAEIYTRANMSKQSFSKIYSGSVVPKKDSIIALALALSLNMDETDDLLHRAGHSLVQANKRDTVFKYFIMTGNHNIHLVNECLFKLNMDMLGNVVA